jgi:hypothetical protein
MAGDWIKMREDLHEDPAVLSMARRLECRPEAIVGYCHKFWSWVSRQCHDGSVTGVTLRDLGDVLSLPGFPELLVEVGWLEYQDSDENPVISIPKFDRHLSQGSKTRGLASLRQRHARVTPMSQKCHAHSVTKTSPEKSREEKRDTKVSLSRGSEFQPPDVTQVEEYCRGRQNSIDAEEFVAFYASKGWMVGKNKMRDWKGAVVTWEKSRQRQEAPPKEHKCRPPTTEDIERWNRGEV